MGDPCGPKGGMFAFFCFAGVLFAMLPDCGFAAGAVAVSSCAVQGCNHRICAATSMDISNTLR